MKILLVEDLPLARKIASYILADLECEVDLAADGAQALKKASHEKYDLIFMDLSLPDATGFEITQRMRAASINTPIYALTAHTDLETREQAFACGMTGFLTKPLETSKIRELLLKCAPEE